MSTEGKKKQPEPEPEEPYKIARALFKAKATEQKKGKKA